MNRFLVISILGLLLLALSPARAQKVIEKKADLKGDQRVVLDLQHANHIRIRGGSGKQLLVRATVDINQGKLNDALLLSLDADKDAVTLKSTFDKELIRAGKAADCPENGYSNWYNSGKDEYRLCTKIDYEVELPAGAAVRVNTISGDIEVTGVTGPIDAKSISGFVDLTWPASKGADVAMKTITGEVYTNQDVVFNNRKSDSPVGYQVRGPLGSGGPVIRLESISGDVFFRKQN